LLRDRRVAILFAAVAAFVFVLFMPETKENLASPQRQQGPISALAYASGS
jgi:hypothetical protein